MPAQTVNYQCPACMGPLHFSGETGKLQCDYCGSQYDPAEIEKLYEKKEDAATEAFQQAEAAPDEFSWTPEGMRAYSCPSCGAEVVCDETTAATSCPYCGNPTVVPGQLGGMLKPDYIIPFKLDKNAAISALKKDYRRKNSCPEPFLRAIILRKFKESMYPFGCLTALRKAAFGQMPNRSAHGRKEIIRSPKSRSTWFCGRVRQGSRGSLWTDLLRCQMSIWIPLSHMTMRGLPNFPLPIFQNFWRRNTMLTKTKVRSVPQSVWRKVFTGCWTTPSNYRKAHLL